MAELHKKPRKTLKERIGALRGFRIYTFFVLALIGIAMTYYLTNYIRSDVLERLTESTSFIVNSTLDPNLSADHFKWPLNKKKQRTYDRLIKRGIISSSKKASNSVHFQSIVAIKVWDVHKRVIYDSSRKTTGQIYRDNKELVKALKGEAVADITKSDSEDKPTEGSNRGHLIEIYAPAIISNNRRPIGAYEIYLSTHSIAKFTQNTIVVITAIIFFSLIFLYFSLSWFFSRAHREITQKNIEAQKLSDRFMHSLKELEDNYLGTMQALTMAVDAKDHYTAGHSFRVASFSKEIGQILGLSDEALRDLERGARFHDIGKIGIKENILNKHGSLTDAEYTEVKRHTVIGAKILGQVKFLADIVPIVRSHHERLDGSGYPDSLTAVNTPLGAKIVAVADVFDAMTTDRPNRKALSTDKAFEELQNGSGKRYDTEVVNALIKAYSGIAKQSA